MSINYLFLHIKDLKKPLHILDRQKSHSKDIQRATSGSRATGGDLQYSTIEYSTAYILRGSVNIFRNSGIKWRAILMKI